MRDSSALIENLRAQPGLDDVSRARMEKALLERAVHRKEQPVRGRSVQKYLLLVAAGALTAALALLAVGRQAELTVVRGSDEVSVAVGRSWRSEDFAEVAHVDAERIELELSPHSEIRPQEIGTKTVLQLRSGAARFTFHPERRGEESLVIETQLARIEVVGTVFHVAVTEDATAVRVSEGVVRVLSRHGEQVLRAGEEYRVQREEVEELASTSSQPAALDAPALDAPAQNATEPAISTEEAEALYESTVDFAETTVSQFGVRRRRASERRRHPEPEVAEAEVAVESPIVAEEPRTPASVHVPLEVVASDDPRLDNALRLIDEGRYGEARARLLTLTRAGGQQAALAWTDIAVTYLREHKLPQAIEAYRRAARSGAGTDVGANALFAIAQVYVLRNDTRANRFYQRYLDAAPTGPLADRARIALCRAGVWAECGALVRER